VAAAVCTLTAAAVIGASLARLVGDPAAYGWAWDVSVGDFASPGEVRRAAGVLDAIPEVDGYTGMFSAALLLDGNSIEAMFIEPGKGMMPLTVLDGREPIGPDEIALGATTMRELGKQIGDTVTVAFAEGQPSQRLRVVGRTVLNAGPQDTAIAPGNGAVLQMEIAQLLSPEPPRPPRSYSSFAWIPLPTRLRRWMR
jgi:putative ABC transport system permease protein